MYFYFYDKFTQEKKYDTVLAKFETRLIELGINGRIERLALFKNAKELIEDGISKGAHTVVAVGDDRTLSNVVNIVAPYKCMVGFVPLDPQSHFAKIFGIPIGEDACNVLSKRLYTTLDLGRVENFFFLGALELPQRPFITLECDAQFTVSTQSIKNQLSVLNLGIIVGASALTRPLSPVDDGKLEVVIAPHIPQSFLHRRTHVKETVLFVNDVLISSTDRDAKVTVDCVATFPIPCHVSVVPHVLRVIVGRNRQLAI